MSDQLNVIKWSEKTSLSQKLNALQQQTDSFSLREKIFVQRALEQQIAQSKDIKQWFEDYVRTLDLGNLQGSDVIVLKTYLALFRSEWWEASVEINSQLDTATFRALEPILLWTLEQNIAQVAAGKGIDLQNVQTWFSDIYGSVMYDESVPLSVRQNFLHDISLALKDISGFSDATVTALRNQRYTGSITLENDKPDSFYAAMLITSQITAKLWPKSATILRVFHDEKVTVNGKEYHKWTKDKLEQSLSEMDTRFWISTQELRVWDKLETAMNKWDWLHRLVFATLQEQLGKTNPQIQEIRYPDGRYADQIQEFLRKTKEIKIKSPQGEQSLLDTMNQYLTVVKDFKKWQRDQFEEPKKQMLKEDQWVWSQTTEFFGWERIKGVEGLVDDIGEKVSKMSLPDIIITVNQLVNAIPILWDLKWLVEDGYAFASGVDVQGEKVGNMEWSLNVIFWVLWVLWIGVAFNKLRKGEKFAACLAILNKLKDVLPQKVREFWKEMPEAVYELFEKIWSVPWFQEFKSLIDDLRWIKHIANDNVESIEWPMNLFFSSFSRNIPVNLRQYKDVHAWANKDWSISYNLNYIEKAYKVKVSWTKWDMLFDGMPLKDYIRSNPVNGKELIEGLKNLRSHEAMHRVLASKWIRDPEKLEVIFADWNRKKYSEEQICHLLDWSYEEVFGVKMPPAEVEAIQSTLKGLFWTEFELNPDYVRRLDTRIVAQRKDVTRLRAVAKSSDAVRDENAVDVRIYNWFSNMPHLKSYDHIQDTILCDNIGKFINFDDMLKNPGKIREAFAYANIFMDALNPAHIHLDPDFLNQTISNIRRLGVFMAETLQYPKFQTALQEMYWKDANLFMMSFAVRVNSYLDYVNTLPGSIGRSLNHAHLDEINTFVKGTLLPRAKSAVRSSHRDPQTVMVDMISRRSWQHDIHPLNPLEVLETCTEFTRNMVEKEKSVLAIIRNEATLKNFYSHLESLAIRLDSQMGDILRDRTTVGPYYKDRIDSVLQTYFSEYTLSQLPKGDQALRVTFLQLKKRFSDLSDRLAAPGKIDDYSGSNESRGQALLSAFENISSEWREFTSIKQLEKWKITNKNIDSIIFSIDPNQWANTYLFMKRDGTPWPNIAWYELSHAEYVHFLNTLMTKFLGAFDPTLLFVKNPIYNHYNQWDKPILFADNFLNVLAQNLSWFFRYCSNTVVWNIVSTNPALQGEIRWLIDTLRQKLDEVESYAVSQSAVAWSSAIEEVKSLRESLRSIVKEQRKFMADVA